MSARAVTPQPARSPHTRRSEVPRRADRLLRPLRMGCALSLPSVFRFLARSSGASSTAGLTAGVRPPRAFCRREIYERFGLAAVSARPHGWTPPG
jgi:hypothetical protein